MANVVYDHIHLRSNAVEKAVSFYEAVLEAERIATFPDGRIDIRLAGLKVIISPAAWELDDAHGREEAPIDHLGFEVKGLVEMTEKLKTMDIEFLQGVRSPKPGVLTAFLLGPDNVKIELIERD